jgi:16S rRNA (guanine527-N7)-methyltransferase
VEHADDVAGHLAQASSAFSVAINQEQIQQFVEYAHLLRKWTRTTNLTAIHDTREVVNKHFIDSIAPLRFGLLSDDAAILDIGTGAGFPSIPLKIMRPDLRLTSLEPNAKKVSFLLSLVGTLHLTSVKVLNQTLHRFADEAQDCFDNVLVRALNLATLGRNLTRVLRQRGTVICYRTIHPEPTEIPPGLEVQKDWPYELPFNHGRRILSVLSVMVGSKPNVPRGTVAPS